MVTFGKRVFNVAEKTKNSQLTGRHIAWMIDEHFMISDTDGAVLDIHDGLKI